MHKEVGLEPVRWLVPGFRCGRITERVNDRRPSRFRPRRLLDRQIRVSGCVVAWFLAQNSSEYYRSFKTALELKW